MVTTTSDHDPRVVAPRTPQQERGAQRVEQILDAASAVIAEVGVKAASVQAIAERAGASMGSLYHFFPSKAAILTALGERMMERVAATNADATADAMRSAPLDVVFDAVVDGQVRLMRELPCFDEVHAALMTAPGGAELHDRLDAALVAQVEAFLEARIPRMPIAQRRAVARFSVKTVHATIDALEGLPAAEQHAAVQELKTAMIRYFAPYDVEFGEATAAAGSPIA